MNNIIINDSLIETIEMDCPICNKVHMVEKRLSLTQSLIKNEVVDHEEIYFLCPITKENENMFLSASVFDENSLKAKNAYRKRFCLLTSDEIIEIRNKYGMDQSELAALFGWSEDTIKKYETKSIQDETHNKLMKMVRDNPIFALSCLEKNEKRFTEVKYNQIREKILKSKCYQKA